MLVKPKMGLVVWDSINDYFSHVQLKSNFEAIDVHNHTEGKGVQIPAGGLAEQSVEFKNLASNVVPAVTAEVSKTVPKDYGIVTALPTGTIIKGSFCTFKAATGIYWRLVYSEEATYPWAKIGGPPLREFIEASQSTASTSYVDLTTVGPSITTPTAGEWRATINNMQWGSTTNEVYAAPSFNGTAPGNLYVRANSSVPQNLTTTFIGTAPKATTIKTVYKVASGTGNYALRTLEIDPIRVG